MLDKKKATAFVAMAFVVSGPFEQVSKLYQ